MFRSWKLVAAAAAAAVLALAAPVAAQSVFGTHTWQLQPYCNVITLTLSPSPGGAEVAGFDNLCGASDRASAVGMASVNATGQVTLNVTIVTAPAGRPVHVTAVVDVRSGGGVWTDSAGNTGTMVYGRSTGGLPPRPIPVTQLGPNVISTLEIAPSAVGAADINTAEVQARVSGSCAAGQAMTSVNANGTVGCASFSGGGGGTGVYFKATGNAQSGFLANGVVNEVNWTNTAFNVGGGTFTPGTSTYVVPSSGLYLLTAVVPNLISQNTEVCANFFINYLTASGATAGGACQILVPPPSGVSPLSAVSLDLSVTVALTAGDTVRVYQMPSAPSAVRISATPDAWSHFSVTKLQ